MKKRLFGVLFVFFSIFCVSVTDSETVSASESVGEVIENDETGIPDRGLYNCILSALDKKQDEKFTKEEAATVSRVEIGSWDHVETFQGIGCLTNIRTLDIENCRMEKLEGMEELPSLQYLSVEGNRLEDLNALTIWNFKNLIYLNVIDNCLQNLAGIENLKDLKILQAGFNQLTSIKELRKLKKLEELDLTGNKLTSISALKNTKKLKILSLAGNQLTSVKAIKNAVQLEELSLAGNKLTSISDLKKLIDLNKLYLQHNRIKKADVLRNFRKLKILDISYNNLKTVPDLTKFMALYSINLKCNYLSEKAIRDTVPQSLLQYEKSGWLQDQINFQNMNFKLLSPANSGKITRKTTKITGTLSRSAAYKKNLYVAFTDTERAQANPIKKVKVGVDGRFTIDKLNLKKWKSGKTGIFRVYIYSEEQKEYIWLDSMLDFVIKK